MREALPDVSVLKLGLTWPLPEKLIRSFAEGVKRLLVVEELEPFLEEQIKAMGLAVSGKAYIPSMGELSPAIVAEKMRRPVSWSNRTSLLPESFWRTPRLFPEDRR